VTENLLNLLDTMKKWISEIPPVSQPQRFGNKAYRTWFQRVHEVRLFSDIFAKTAIGTAWLDTVFSYFYIYCGLILKYYCLIQIITAQL